MSKYQTRAAVLEALANGRHVKPSEVAPRVLRARVWIAGAGSPGCLYDSGPNYHASARDAIEDCVFIAENGEGASRGLRSELRAYGAAYRNGWRYEVSADTLGSLL